MPATLVHPRLVPGAVEARAYQVEAVATALAGPTLLVLPTGLGKTAIEWAVVAERLRAVGGRAILLAPTNVLVDQHRRMLGSVLTGVEDGRLVALTGSVAPAKRGAVWSSAEVVVATPQVMRNDVVAGRLDLRDVSVMIADEAHHARGAEAMAQVGEQYRAAARNPLILAATASPGADADAIEELCRRLELQRIHARQADDALVAPHAVGLDVHEVRVEVPERLREMAAPLEDWLDSIVSRLKRLGWYTRQGQHVTTAGLQQSFGHIQVAIKAGDARGYQAAKQAADGQRLLNLIGGLLSQGVAATRESLERMAAAAQAGEARVVRFMSDPRMVSIVEGLQPMPEIHPKVAEVRRLVLEQLRRQPDSRVMVFATFRDTGSELVAAMSDMPEVRAERFVGQSRRGTDEGLSQTEQLAVLDSFRSGERNVLVATSVGEEGLDVPAADRVILYEPVGSEIRTIQRRGRTGRHREGEVFVLLARGTRDEGARAAAKAKEGRMRGQLEKVSGRLGRWSGVGPEVALEAFGIQPEQGEVQPAAGWLVRETERLLALAEGAEDPGRLDPPAADPPPWAAPTGDEETVDPQERAGVGRQALSAQRLRPDGQTGLEGFAAARERAAEAALPTEARPQRSDPVDDDGLDVIAPGLAAASERVAVGAAVQATVSLVEEGAAGSTTLPSPAPRTTEGKVLVDVDHRELASAVAASLRLQDVELQSTTLQHGDYRIGERVLIERKTARDFVASLLDGRLLEQASRLVAASPRAILLVEGAELFSQRSVHPNALMGAMACLVIEFGLPVITTANGQETARFIAVAARREEALITGLERAARRRLDSQRSIAWRRLLRAGEPDDPVVIPTGIETGATIEDLVEEGEALAVALEFDDPEPPLDDDGQDHATPAPATLQPRWDLRADELCLLKAIPGIGERAAAALLERFGSLPAIIAASAQDLVGTQGVGPARAAAIHRLFHDPE